MNRYQGEDIPFSIKIWKNREKTEAVNIDNLSEIIIYVYTDGYKKVVFSKSRRDGYIQLGRNSECEYWGIIDSSVTKLMSPGTLNIEINIAENEASVSDGKWNLIQRGSFGILRKSLIKIES